MPSWPKRQASRCRPTPAERGIPLLPPVCIPVAGGGKFSLSFFRGMAVFATTAVPRRSLMHGLPNHPMPTHFDNASLLLNFLRGLRYRADIGGRSIPVFSSGFSLAMSPDQTYSKQTT